MLTRRLRELPNVPGPPSVIIAYSPILQDTSSVAVPKDITVGACAGYPPDVYANTGTLCSIAHHPPVFHGMTTAQRFGEQLVRLYSIPWHT
jgi:hypothetical protein